MADAVWQIEMPGQLAKHWSKRICLAEYPKVYRVFCKGFTCDVP
jgi:hypothetical protein